MMFNYIPINQQQEVVTYCYTYFLLNNISTTFYCHISIFPSTYIQPIYISLLKIIYDYIYNN